MQATMGQASANLIVADTYTLVDQSYAPYFVYYFESKYFRGRDFM